MNKKAIIICVSSIVAVAAIIFAILAVTTNLFSKDNGSSSGNDINSSASDKNNGSGSSEAGNKVIEKGGITIGSVSGKKGDTITVPVKIKDNPGIMAYLLKFNFDNTVLEYVEYKKGDFLTDYQVNAAENIVSFLNVEDKDVDTNGTIVNLVFKIKSDAKSGTYKITLPIDNGSICNKNEETIMPTVTNGQVTVK